MIMIWTPSSFDAESFIAPSQVSNYDPHLRLSASLLQCTCQSRHGQSALFFCSLRFTLLFCGKRSCRSSVNTSLLLHACHLLRAFCMTSPRRLRGFPVAFPSRALVPTSSFHASRAVACCPMMEPTLPSSPPVIDLALLKASGALELIPAAPPLLGDSKASYPELTCHGAVDDVDEAQQILEKQLMTYDGTGMSTHAAESDRGFLSDCDEAASTVADSDIGQYADGEGFEEASLDPVPPSHGICDLAAVVRARRKKTTCNFECGRPRCAGQIYCSDCHVKNSLAARNAIRCGPHAESVFKDLRATGGAHFKAAVMSYAEECLGFGRGTRAKPFNWMQYERVTSVGTSVNKGDRMIWMSKHRYYKHKKNHCGKEAAECDAFNEYDELRRRLPRSRVSADGILMPSEKHVECFNSREDKEHVRLGGKIEQKSPESRQAHQQELDRKDARKTAQQAKRQSRQTI